MAGDDVVDVAREQPVAVLFHDQQARACACERGAAEREAGRIHRRGGEPEQHQRDRGCGRREGLRHLAGEQERGSAERKHACDDDDAARGGKRGLDRDDHEPHGGEGRDPAGGRADRRDQNRQRDRRHDLRALVAAGAREIAGDEQRRRQPRIDEDVERAGHAADREVDRQRGQRQQAADHARRDERAMARGGQRVAPRRHMHQLLDEGADLRVQAHVTPDTPHSGRAPLASDRRRGGLNER